MFNNSLSNTDDFKVAFVNRNLHNIVLLVFYGFEIAKLSTRIWQKYFDNGNRPRIVTFERTVKSFLIPFFNISITKPYYQSISSDPIFSLEISFVDNPYVSIDLLSHRLIKVSYVVYEFNNSYCFKNVLDVTPSNLIHVCNTFTRLIPGVFHTLPIYEIIPRLIKQVYDNLDDEVKRIVDLVKMYISVYKNLEVHVNDLKNDLKYIENLLNTNDLAYCVKFSKDKIHIFNVSKIKELPIDLPKSCSIALKLHVNSTSSSLKTFYYMIFECETFFNSNKILTIKIDYGTLNHDYNSILAKLLIHNFIEIVKNFAKIAKTLNIVERFI